jgi:ribosome-associated toxin RatA of RatAB toxin-antitoxin module
MNTKKTGVSLDRLRHGLSLFLFALLLWVLVIKPYPAPSEGADFWSTAKRERRVFVGIEDDHLVGRFWANASPARLQGLLLDINSYPKVFPAVSRITELSHSASEVAAGGRITVFGPFSVSFSFGAKAEPPKDGVYRITWTGTGTGLSENDGSWELRPYNDGTAVSYRIHLKPAAMFFPARVSNRIVIQFLPGKLRAFMEAES